MSLRQICIDCNQGISPSETPVYKDNNGALIYHSKCLKAVLITEELGLEKCIKVMPLKVVPIPVDIAAGYHQVVPINFFIGPPKYFNNTGGYDVSRFSIGDNINGLFRLLDKWKAVKISSNEKIIINPWNIWINNTLNQLYFLISPWIIRNNIDWDIKWGEAKL